jgi:hypothetical protein
LRTEIVPGEEKDEVVPEVRPSLAVHFAVAQLILGVEKEE